MALSPFSPCGPAGPIAPISPGTPRSPFSPFKLTGIDHSVILSPEGLKIAKDIQIADTFEFICCDHPSSKPVTKPVAVSRLPPVGVLG